MATIAFKAADEVVLVVGEKPGAGWLGQSIYLREVAGEEKGAPPPVDLKHELMVGNFVRSLIAGGRVRTCHDISDGGLLVAVAEMALAGNIGCRLLDPAVPHHAALFGEDQGRYLVTVDSGDTADRLRERSLVLGVNAAAIGWTGGDTLTLGAARPVPVEELKTAHESWFPRYMAGEL